MAEFNSVKYRQVYLIKDLTNNMIYVGRASHNNRKYFGSSDRIMKLIVRFISDNISIELSHKEVFERHVYVRDQYIEIVESRFKKTIIEDGDWTQLHQIEREDYWIQHYRNLDKSLLYNKCLNSGKWLGTANDPEAEQNRIEKSRQSRANETKEAKELRISRVKATMQTPEFRAAHSKKLQDPIINAKTRAAIKANMTNPEIIDKIRQSGKITRAVEGWSAEHSNKTKAALQRPEVKHNMLKAIPIRVKSIRETCEKRSPEKKKQISDNRKALESNPDFKKRKSENTSKTKMIPENREKASRSIKLMKAMNRTKCSIFDINYESVEVASKILKLTLFEIRTKCLDPNNLDFNFLEDYETNVRK